MSIYMTDKKLGTREVWCWVSDAGDECELFCFPVPKEPEVVVKTYRSSFYGKIGYIIFGGPTLKNLRLARRMQHRGLLVEIYHNW